MPYQLGYAPTPRQKYIRAEAALSRPLLRLLVFLKDDALDLFTGLRGDWVGDIPELALRRLAAGHGHEQPVLPLDNPDISDHEGAVEGD